MDSPAEVFKRLSDGAGERRRRSLGVIREVCEAQRQCGSVDFSLTTIGRLSQAEGGPQTDALGNRSGAVYRQLIACYSAAVRSTRKRSTADGDGLLDGVRDPIQRARIENLRDEVRVLRGQVNDLQKIANAGARVKVGRTDGSGVGALEGRFEGPPGPDLLPYEREALEQALNPVRLKRAGLVVGARGRIDTRDGMELFPNGFVGAVQKLLAFCQAPAESSADAPMFGGSDVGGPTDTTA